MLQPQMTTAGRRVLSDVVHHEYAFNFCRETEVLKAGNSVAVGGLVGKITASGKVVPWDPAASDGSEVVYGIAVEDCVAPVGVDNDMTSYIVRGPAIILAQELPGAYAAANSGQKAAVKATLATKNILLR